jgi:hypothetical protein
MKQKELEDAILEVQRLAIERLREKLEHEKRIAYTKFLKLEKRVIDHNQQLSRAFVYSYYDALDWIEATA